MPRLLREKWLAHIEAAIYRPVLIIDEAQEMNSLVLSELRLLASADLDSRSILTIILAGDQRLATRLEEPDLLPIASRMRSRLRLEALPPKALQECLSHLLKAAGNPKLLSPSLIQTLCEHAAGNLRLLMNMANDLLVAASQQEREVIDEKLFFEVFAWTPSPPKSREPACLSNAPVNWSAVARKPSGWSRISGPTKPSASWAASPNAAKASWPWMWP